MVKLPVTVCAPPFKANVPVFEKVVVPTVYPLAVVCVNVAFPILPVACVNAPLKAPEPVTV